MLVEIKELSNKMIIKFFAPRHSTFFVEHLLTIEKLAILAHL